MARYKHVDMSPRLLPVDLESQLVPGSFAHAVHHLVDRLDLSGFDAHYCNDATGATAHALAMLLKAVLLGYSQGMVSSRSIERACRDNVLFIAITGDAKPHFTTIADFVSRSRDEVALIFAQVLTILGNEGLIGREMFAIDGVKLPSNASKHRAPERARVRCREDLCAFARRGNGGESGIRTHGGDKPTAVFKTAALNHSAISPFTCPDATLLSQASLRPVSGPAFRGREFGPARDSVAQAPALTPAPGRPARVPAAQQSHPQSDADARTGARRAQAIRPWSPSRDTVDASHVGT